MTDMLKTLTALYGPSGNEGEVQAWILAYLREKQIDAHTDALGNIIAKVGGSGKKLVFSAHMDTVGVMLTEIDKDGYGKFTAIGWLDPASIAHTPVRFENGTVAAICIRDDKVGKELKAGDLYLDFGTGSNEESQERGVLRLFRAGGGRHPRCWPCGIWNSGQHRHCGGRDRSGRCTRFHS